MRTATTGRPILIRTKTVIASTRSSVQRFAWVVSFAVLLKKNEFPDLTLNFQAGEFYFKRSEFLPATLEIFVPTIEREMEHVIN